MIWSSAMALCFITLGILLGIVTFIGVGSMCLAITISATLAERKQPVRPELIDPDQTCLDAAIEKFMAEDPLSPMATTDFIMATTAMENPFRSAKAKRQEEKWAAEEKRIEQEEILRTKEAAEENDWRFKVKLAQEKRALEEKTMGYYCAPKPTFAQAVMNDVAAAYRCRPQDYSRKIEELPGP